MTGWQYLLLVNIYLLLFYGFYVLLLRKETFFQLNRIYLVAASLLSFFIPMIQSDWVQNLFITKEFQLTLYSSPLVVYRFQPIQHTQITIGQVLMIIYLAGILLLLGRFVWQMIVLKKMINQPDAAAAYSFFKKIKLAPHQAENEVIAEHERVHANQWHSADVLLIEAVMIINWFNPVVYFYRHAIKHIHEFIADRQALKSGTDKGDYALLLLSQTFNAPTHQLVNPFFNHSLLKQRIIMLQKNKSNRIALIKYGLSAPLFILMLVLSSATINNSKTVELVNKKAEQVFLTPATITQPENAPDSTIVILSPAQAAATAKTQTRTLKFAETASDTVPSKRDAVFTSVEKVPEFPGGIEGFGQYLAKNMKYPVKLRNEGVQGKVVITFIVEKDGSITGVKVARGVAAEMDKEAVRVIANSPKWIPGRQNGKPVRVVYSVPISFTLADAEPKGKAGVSQNTVPETGSSSLLTPDTGRNSMTNIGKKTINSPLYVIDGKVVEDLMMLNPNDISSVSVLRDANAVAVYGPKAVNGVIVIATKPKPKEETKPAPKKEKDPGTRN